MNSFYYLLMALALLTGLVGGGSTPKAAGRRQWEDSRCQFHQLP